MQYDPPEHLSFAPLLITVPSSLQNALPFVQLTLTRKQMGTAWEPSQPKSPLNVEALTNQPPLYPVPRIHSVNLNLGTGSKVNLSLCKGREYNNENKITNRIDYSSLVYDIKFEDQGRNENKIRPTNQTRRVTEVKCMKLMTRKRNSVRLYCTIAISHYEYLSPCSLSRRTSTQRHSAVIIYALGHFVTIQ